ncbi:unnamed protein product [Calypogeia fissa]
MALELERNGDKAIVDEDYDQAVSLYTQAIDLDPTNAPLYASRAQAHIKLENYSDAAVDANRALELDLGLSKAHLRKGFAYFYLEDYQTARAAFEAGAPLDPNNSQYKMWIRKCDAELEAAAEDKQDAERGLSANASGMPSETVKETEFHATSMDTANGISHDRQDLAECSAPAVTGPQLPPQPKYRHEWYQNDSQAVVTIFAKNLKPDHLKVEFGEQILSVIITRPDEEPFYLQLRLFGKIKPLESKYIVLSTKVEIRLVKAGQLQWKGLEFDPDMVIVPVAVLPVALRPVAPKKPTKNWDKLEAEVRKAEKDEKLEGDAALNKLFQDIYSNADEDTRRAMNKSFVESNGTVLSTNWKEVGSKKVDGSPPKGMEMRKWEQ